MDRLVEGHDLTHRVSPSQLVREFNDVMGIIMPDSPDAQRLSDPRLAEKIVSMLTSEINEVAEEVRAGDLEGVAHELADVVYSAFGAALELGIDLDDAILRVHNANLTRSSGGVIERNAVGKIKKGMSYKSPRP